MRPTRFRIALPSELRKRIPAGIEENKHRFDFMSVGDTQKLVHPFFESFGVLLPEQIVQKDPQGIHPQTLRPTKLFVDRLRIKAFRLK